MSSSCGFNEANRRRLGQVEQDRQRGTGMERDAPQAVDMLCVFRFGIMKIVPLVVVVVAVVARE